MSWCVREIEDDAFRLLSIDGLGGSTLARIIHMSGGVNEAGKAVMHGCVQDWLPTGASALLKARMLSLDIEAARRSADAIDTRVVIVTDDDFPKLLVPLPACPAAIWYRGSLAVTHTPCIAIVGSRRCSEHGIQNAHHFAQEIVASGIAIVSGGARGIDAAAHRGALCQKGRTCAVLGSGLSELYPPEHKKLFQEIISTGGVVLSEFPCHVPPRPANFPRRNRIVSGLSTLILVIEAAKRSGALITARIAVEEHGRQAMAIPGRLGDPTSAGCLQAIRDGWMAVAINPCDVIEEANQAWGRLSRVHQESQRC